MVVPERKSYSIVVVEFLAHGEIRPDGRNVLVAARNKETVPYRVLQVGPGDFCRVAFQTVAGQSVYEVFYGGEPPRDEPPAWTCHDGLLLETRQFRRCNLRSLDSVRQAFEAAAPIGADYVEGVFHAANPCSLKREPFLSRYSGYLHLNESGTYGFYTSSRDCSFLLIDGKLIASDPGRHGPRHRAVPGSRHDVRLTAGEHKFEYYHAAAGPEAMMAADWEINPSEKPRRPTKIPAAAFNAHLVGRLPAGREIRRVGGAAPDFTAEIAGEVPLPDDPVPMLGVKFHNLSPQTLTAPGAKIRWDFGDGQSSELLNVDHVYLRPGLYEVTLSIRRGVRTAKATNRIYIDRPELPPGKDTHTLDEYLRIIEDYDPSKLDAASLRQLALAFEAKALAKPEQAESYLSKAVHAVQTGLRDGSVAKGDDLLKLAALVGPMARFRLGDSAAAFEIWSAAARRADAAETKAVCELAAADIAVNDLLRAAAAKPLLEAAEKSIGKSNSKELTAQLQRIRGDYDAATGDGKAARKAYLEAERILSTSRQFNVETAKRGAHARSTEAFIAAQQYVRAARRSRPGSARIRPRGWTAI